MARARAVRDARGLASSFKAPLLERILSEEKPEQRQVILDLGRPAQLLLERLGQIGPCRVEIADLVGSGALTELRAPEFLEQRGPAAVRDYLPPAREALDLVFCWDLPNYLSLNVFSPLCHVLGERAKPGCRLHMLIAYSKREMPAAPARYALTEEGQLIQQCEDASLTAAPRYSPESLGNAVAGFRYERGVLLANGMQEFVYAWPGEPDADRFR
jgi:hypothetical protein